MKPLLLILFFTLNAFAETKDLARYEFRPSLLRPPQTQIVHLKEDGKVFLELQDSNVRANRMDLLATLSPFALKNTLKQISKVNPSAPLVDRNPEAPQCMDFPTINVFIVRDDQEVLTFQNRNCHNHSLEDFSAEAINQLMLGFGQLRILQ